MNTYMCAALVATFCCLFARTSRADTITGNLNLDVVMGTLTVETTGGDVLDTFDDLSVSETIPADLATQIAADPIVPAYIQSDIGLFVAESTLGYITGSFSPELLSVSGSLGTASGDFTIVPDDLASITLGPLTSNSGLVAVANNQYALEPPGYFYVVNVNYYTDSVVETVAATPEPHGLALASLGAMLAFGLALHGRRGRCRQGEKRAHGVPE